MKQYWRWIVFGVIAIGIIVLLVLVGANQKLRQQLVALLLEQKVKTEIAGLKDKAIIAKTKADSGKIEAEEAEQVANETEEAISKKKETLQKKYESDGLDTDEIANRFNNLGV
jgi:hypothetical protein